MDERETFGRWISGFALRLLLLTLAGAALLLLDVLALSWLPALFHAAVASVLGCVLWREYVEDGLADGGVGHRYRSAENDTTTENLE